MKTSHALLLGLILAASSSAFAQYSWVDKDGHRVFSDQPPPADVPQANIRTMPLMPTAPAAPAEDASAAPLAGASAPSGVDKTLEEKKKQAEAEQAAKQKAEADKIAAQKADNCKRAMNYKTTLDSGIRVARTNSKTGAREILDDTQRAAEQTRVQQAIAQNCN